MFFVLNDLEIFGTVIKMDQNGRVLLKGNRLKGQAASLHLPNHKAKSSDTEVSTLMGSAGCEETQKPMVHSLSVSFPDSMQFSGVLLQPLNQ